MLKVELATFEKEIKDLRVKSCVLDVGVWEVKFYNCYALYVTISVMAESNKAVRIEWNVKAADPAEADKIEEIKLAENPRLCRIAEKTCASIAECSKV